MGGNKNERRLSSTTLFVRNLAASVKETDVEAHFGGIGPLRSCIVVCDPETGESRRYAFVSYALAEHAAIAVGALNKSTLSGRKLNVEYARHRERSREVGDADDVGQKAPDNYYSAFSRKKSKLPQKVDIDKGVGKTKQDNIKSTFQRGALAMRTVVLRRRDGRELTEASARNAFEKLENASVESVILTLHGKEARCTFESWATAGRAAAFVHGKVFDACIDALLSGSQSTLIIRNLPFHIAASTVRKAFENIVPIRNIRLAPVKQLTKIDSTPKPKDNTENGTDDYVKNSSEADTIIKTAGYGFVEFFTAEDARCAMQKVNGTSIKGRVIAVDMALERNRYIKKVKHSEDPGSEKADDNSGNSGDESSSPKSGNEKKLESIVQPETGNSERHDNSEKWASDTKDDSAKFPGYLKKRSQSSPEELERTVFVCNLPYESTNAEIQEALQPMFGTIEQVFVVKDPVTKISRGTAFVRFSKAEDAKRAIEVGGSNEKEDKLDSRNYNEGKAKGVQVLGRNAVIMRALNRDDFKKQKTERYQNDPRNLRLAWIGYIDPESKEGHHLSTTEWEIRTKAALEKKNKLGRNPNTFVSDVRLSVRNLPQDMDEGMLRLLFIRASQSGNQKNVNNNEQTSDVVSGNGNQDSEAKDIKKNSRVGHIVHCSIVRDQNRDMRSKRYGFVQFERHKDALRALHAVNNDKQAVRFLFQQPRRKTAFDQVKYERRKSKHLEMWGKERCLIVEFSVENRRKVRILERIRQRGNERRNEHLRSNNAQGTPSATLPGEPIEKRLGIRKLSRMQKRKRERQGSSTETADASAWSSSFRSFHGQKDHYRRGAKRRRVG